MSRWSQLSFGGFGFLELSWKWSHLIFLKNVICSQLLPNGVIVRNRKYTYFCVCATKCISNMTNYITISSSPVTCLGNSIPQLRLSYEIFSLEKWYTIQILWTKNELLRHDPSARPRVVLAVTVAGAWTCSALVKICVNIRRENYWLGIFFTNCRFIGQIYRCMTLMRWVYRP